MTTKLFEEIEEALKTIHRDAGFFVSCDTQ